MKRVAAAAVLFAVLLAGTALAAGLEGTYTTTLRGASPAFLNGGWKIKFSAGGGYTLRHAGMITARGVWSVSGSKLTITDKSGPIACTLKTDRGPATYRWKLSAGRLTLRAIHDRCGGRETVLTAHALKRR